MREREGEGGWVVGKLFGAFSNSRERKLSEIHFLKTHSAIVCNSDCLPIALFRNSCYFTSLRLHHLPPSLRKNTEINIHECSDYNIVENNISKLHRLESYRVDNCVQLKSH